MTATDAKPCQCHDSLAYISPIHPGHCCFRNPDATCHPAEVAAWEQRRDAWYRGDPSRGGGDQ